MGSSRTKPSRFSGPFTQHVERTLTISNYNDQPVAFKITTNAPKVCLHYEFDSRVLIPTVWSLSATA